LEGRLEFRGNGRIVVKGEDRCIIGKGGYGGVRWGWKIYCVYKVEEWAEDAALWYSRVYRGKACGFIFDLYNKVAIGQVRLK
jgi:hypothetical protein